MGDVHITDLIDPEQLAALRAAAAGEQPPEEKRQFTAKERHDAPTMPGTDSYPIENLADLDNAIQAWGRSKPEDREKLKRWLLTRARALKAPKETVDRIEALGGGDGKSTMGRGTSEDRVARMNAKDDGELEPLEVKDPGDPAGMEHKSDAGVGGAQVLTVDDDTGVVEALVSVTNIEDRVKDVIEPGAYAETLAQREPIGVWSHDDKTWVARTEEARELMPGDPMFKGMKTMDGKPWPVEAGAVYVKSRFNLETPHGKAAYSDVKFFQGKTGWSIGYRVTKGQRNPRTGQRRIKALDWYEYSPVMVGAASQPMTLSVKSLAQPVDPDEATGFVDVDALEALEPAELGRYVELKESLGLEVKDRVRTAAGQARFGQPIGSVIVPDTLNKLSAGDVKVGMEVDFQGGAPGAGAKPVKGKVSKVSRDGDTVTLTVNGEDHKARATSPITVTQGMPKDAPLRDADLAVMIKDAMKKGDNAEVAVIRRAAALPPEKRRAFLTTGESAKNVSERGSDKPSSSGGAGDDKVAARAAEWPVGTEVELDVHGINGKVDTVRGKVIRHDRRGNPIVDASAAGHGELSPERSKMRRVGGPDLSKLSESELEDLRSTLEKRGDQRGADKVTSEMQDRSERDFAEQRAKNAARRSSSSSSGKYGPAPEGVNPAAWEAANNHSLDGLDPDDPKFRQVGLDEGIDKDDLVEAAEAIGQADPARKPKGGGGKKPDDSADAQIARLREMGGLELARAAANTSHTRLRESALREQARRGRELRNAPKRRAGSAVEVDGKPGKVVGHASTGHVTVKFSDGEVRNFHPSKVSDAGGGGGKAPRLGPGPMPDGLDSTGKAQHSGKVRDAAKEIAPVGSFVKLGNTEYRVSGHTMTSVSKSYNNEQGDKVDVGLHRLNDRGMVAGRTSTRITLDKLQAALVRKPESRNPEAARERDQRAAPKTASGYTANPIPNAKPSRLTDAEKELSTEDMQDFLGNVRSAISSSPSSVGQIMRDKAERFRKEIDRRVAARDRDRADDARGNAVTKEREKLAALNRRRKARGQAPLLRLPNSVKSLRLADTPDDVLDAYIDTDPTAELDDVEAKRSRASLDSSPRSNWVEETGELPGYIREVARAIHQDHGTPLSRAIPMAIGRIKKWAAGGGDVSADTRAKAAKAVAEWEALKAKARAKYDSTLLSELELKGVIEAFETEVAAESVTDDPAEDDFVDLLARGQELKSELDLPVDISDLVAARAELGEVVPPFSETKAAVRRGEGPGARRRAEAAGTTPAAAGGAGGGYARVVRTEAGARRYGVRVGETYTPGQRRAEQQPAGRRPKRSVEDDDPGHDLDPEGKVPQRGQEGPITENAQEVLVRLGLLEPRKDGSVHGKFGPRTEEAVREFQESNGLPVTGKLTAETMSSIKAKDPGKSGGPGSSTRGGSSGSSSPSSASGGERPAGAPSRDRPPPGDRPAGDEEGRTASWFSSLDRVTQQRVLARARAILAASKAIRR